MLELPRHHVPRRALRTRVADPPVIVVEASSGFGKSTFASELAAGQRASEVALSVFNGSLHRFLLMLQRALRSVEEHAAASALSFVADDTEEMLDAMADALEEAAPLCLVIDDTHHLSDAADVLVSLAQRRPPALRLIITARVLPAAARRLLDLPGIEHVQSEELRFRFEDASFLLRERLGLPLKDAQIDDLLAATDGWPAGLVLAGARLRRSGGGFRLPPVSTLSEDFAGLVLSSVPEALQREVIQLSHLPAIDPAVADALGMRTGVLAEILRVGLPLAQDENGAIRLPGALADALRRRAPLEPEAAHRVAQVLLDRGAPFEALTVLRIAGDSEGIARVLAEMPASARRVLTADEVITAIEALPLTVAERPELLIELARAVGRTGTPGPPLEILDRAASAAAGDPRRERAIEAERLVTQVYTLYPKEREELEARLRALIDSCGPGEERTLGRALLVRGQQLAWDGRRADADHTLRRAARLLIDAGEDYEASRILVQRGFIVHLHEQLSLAERTFARAVELAGIDGRVRATALTYLGEVKIWRGRPEDGVADLEEAADLARAVRDGRALAYTLWGLALQASVSGDVERTVSRVDQAARHLRPWMDTGVGATFVATMSDLLDRVGAVEEADRMLGEARRRRSEAPELTVLAEFGVAARRGDPEQAERLWRDVESDDGIEPFERVRCRILRAYAALRREAPETIRRYRELLADGESLGEDGVPWHLEPEAAHALRQWWSRRSNGWRIRVLGEFAVRRGAETVALPPGRPSDLVLLLTLQSRTVPLDSVLEALWPGSSPDAAGRRLRQVMYRLRRVAPDLVVRDEHGLRLDAEAQVDLAEFERRIARFDRDGEETESAVQALALVDAGFFSRTHSSALAPVFETVRDRVRAQVVRMRDSLADDTAEEKDAVDHLHHAHELDPANTVRARELAARLLASGRAGQAQSVIDTTVDALSELDLPVTPALLEIEKLIRQEVR